MAISFNNSDRITFVGFPSFRWTNYKYRYDHSMNLQPSSQNLLRKEFQVICIEMAPSMLSALAFGLLFALLGLRGVRGDIKCEELPAKACAFSVSSRGERCVLEKYSTRDGTLQFQCQSSVVMAEKIIEWIESEECINACGLERMSVGMSSDSLLEADFTSRLCSENCQNNCPNIVDLYLNLAAGEGIHLPWLCEVQRSSSRRQMEEFVRGAKSSSITYHSFGAPPPEHGQFGDFAASAPVPF